MFISHTKSPPGPKTSKFFCPRCGWTMDAGGVGIKSECPDCKHELNILDGTKEEVDNRVASVKIYMEDINSIALEATELIEKKLKELGVTLITPKEDEFYIPISDTLEQYSNGDYRSHN